jgi:hypothetical protein
MGRAPSSRAPRAASRRWLRRRSVRGARPFSGPRPCRAAPMGALAAHLARALRANIDRRPRHPIARLIHLAATPIQLPRATYPPLGVDCARRNAIRMAGTRCTSLGAPGFRIYTLNSSCRAGTCVEGLNINDVHCAEFVGAGSHCDDAHRCLDPNAPVTVEGVGSRPGLVCGSDGTCQPPYGQGTFCQLPEQCASYYCTESVTEGCGPPHADGFRCSDDRSCASGYCEYDDAFHSRCATGGAAIGASCATGSGLAGCASGACAGGRCVPLICVGLAGLSGFPNGGG